jgi:hypothetical protein
MEQNKNGILKTVMLVCTTLNTRTHAWWRPRFDEHPWRKKFSTCIVAVTLLCVILVSIGMITMHKAGWIFACLIGILIMVELLAQRHYHTTFSLLRRLDELVHVAESSGPGSPTASTKNEPSNVPYDPRGKTAILLVNGFNGLGLHTLFSVIRLFGSAFTNFVFIQIGVLNASNLKDPAEVSRNKNDVSKELDRYVNYMQRHGYYALGYPSCGADVVNEIVRITPEVLEQFPNAIFFGGQLVFPKATFMSGLFHNYTIFSVQKRFYEQGIPIVILPIRVL